MIKDRKIVHQGIDFSLLLDEASGIDVSVIVKQQSKAEQSPSLNYELKNEWELTHSLNIEGVRKALKLDTVEGVQKLYLEHVKGTSLREYFVNREWNLNELLEVSISMAKILGSIHSAGIIHKDVNSRNILIDAKSKMPVFIDFGIATKLNLKSDFSISPKKLEGSISFISPEQTGRMNRMVDYRSDLYSLGVTLYELFTGVLPFEAKGASELVYCHIARNPIPPNQVNPNIPDIISEIILKLLEKNSENRFQSAIGLKHDLERFRDIILKNKSSDGFKLAEYDFSRRFQVSQKLFGREREVKQMLNEFNLAATGTFKLTFIKGFSGVGKSSLVHEIYRPVTEHHGLFIEGKFDQYQRDIPYQAITYALTNLVKLLLGEPDDKLAKWKELIIDAAGINSGVLTALVPELEVIIGRQKKPSVVGPLESQNRFNFTFIQFIKRLATKEHPLVLFLDDLQSADHASLSLIETLLSDPSISYFYFIGSFRDNEVGIEHPLRRTLSNLEKILSSVSIIKLRGLNKDSVHDLLSETLNTSKGDCEQLGEIVSAKTDNNPYFILEFLKSLHEDELIIWDEKKLKWSWDEKEIAKSAATENVVQFLTRKISSYSDDTLNLMKISSCIGNSFSINLLQNVSGKSASYVVDRLNDMMADGYILPLGSKQIFEDQNQVISAFSTYKFVHDRFQQAIYDLIEYDERVRIHFRIGKELKLLQDEGDESIKAFEIVNHLNEAKDILSSKEEEWALCQLNYAAGIKAKESSAWNAANRHYNIANGLLPINHWQNHHDFTFKLFLELAQSEFLNGQVERSEQLMDSILKNSNSKFEQALVINQKIVLNGVQGNYDEAISLSRKCLGLLNVKMPSTTTGIRIGILNGLIKAGLRLRKKNPNHILSLPADSSKEGALVLKVISDTTFSAYYVNREYYLLLQLVATNYSLKHGNTEYSPFPYANYAVIQLALFRRYRYALDFCQPILNLNDQYSNQLVRGRILSPIKSGILHWSLPLAELKKYYDEGITISMQSGDQWYSYSAQLNYFALKLKMGVNLNVIEDELREFQPHFDKQDNTFHKSEYDLYRLFIRMMKDPTIKESEIESFQVKFLNENINNEFLLGYMYCFLCRIGCLFGNVDEALQNATKLKKVIAQFAASPWEADSNFYMTLAIAMDDSVEVSRRSSIVEKRLKLFTKLEDNCPENFSCYASILRAEIKQLQNNIAQSLEEYALASKQAKENEFVHLDALANERAGRLCVKHRFKYEGEKYLQKAFVLYKNWGASNKVDSLRREFPELDAVETTQRTYRTNRDVDFVSESESFINESLDLNTVMKASTALSEEVKFEGLLDILIKITMENAGAQRVILVLDKEKESLPKVSVERKGSDINLFFGIPSAESKELPVSLIQYVSRTNEDLVLDDATVDFRFSKDLYFQEQLPYSILCLPIHYQGDTIGVLYLENSLTSGVFSNERLKLIRLLSGQIAVSIENSLLYENLEEKVVERTKELSEEKRKSDVLLLNILPEEVADELKETGKSVARQFDNVSVLFTDFKSFIKTAESFTAQQLVEELNICFEAFDNIVSKLGMDKIKTIGDAYMAAGGLQEQSQFKPKYLVIAGLEMQEFMLARKKKRLADNLPAFDMRVGIHSGPVVAGIVGVQKFQYDIWGDTVNTASRMESSGEVGKVNISQATYELLKDDMEFAFEKRGKIEVKGKGEMKMWFVSRS